LNANPAGKRDRSRQVSLALLAGALVILLLSNIAQPVNWQEVLAPILLFSGTLVCVSDLAQWVFTPGLILSTGYTSMAHVVALAALLATGVVPALWVVVLGTALVEALRQLLARRITGIYILPRQAWLAVAATVGINATSLGLAGAIYQWVGGSTAALAWTWRDGLAVITLFGSHFLVYNTLNAWWLRARGTSIPDYFQRHLLQILTLQLVPLPFAVLLTRVYLQLGALIFLLLCASLIGLWTLLRRLVEMRRDLEKRLRELRTLNTVGQALATSLELDVLLNTIYHQVRRLMEADYFYIALYDGVTDELTFPVVVEDGERKYYAGRRAGNGLTEYVIRRRKPVLIPGHTAQVIANLGLEVIGQPALSWLGVPLAAGDKVLGVITVQSFRRSHAYDQEDMALLCILATQAAIALENAKLYGQMRRRTAELALLNTVSTAVSSTLDLDQVLQIVVTSIPPIMLCQKSALYLVNGPGGKLQLSASHGLSDAFKQSLIWQDDLRLQQVRDQHIFIVPDITTSGRPAAEVEWALREGYRAFAEVPLVTQNELIGILSVYYDQVHYFDLAERDLLTTFANQAATAIANARLYSRTDQALARRVEELSAIERIGRELTSTLEPQRVLDLVLEQAMTATGATRGCIAMLNGTGHLVNVVTQRGYTAQATESLTAPHQLDEGIVGHVLRNGQLALIRDVQREPHYVALDPAVQAHLTVPITREGTVLGAINLESARAHGFDEQDANFVSQLAIQAAVALENAQLFQERSQRVEELSLLYQASLTLASSLEYTDVLDIISRLARHVTNSDAVALYLYDAVTDEFERASVQGYQTDEIGPPTVRRNGMTRTIIETGRPVLISDALTHPDISSTVLQRGIRSIIGVPVMSRGEALGVLYVNHRQPHAYTENDVRLVSALANQAGATIANVSLFTQVSEARDRLEAIINSTRDGILVLDNAGRVVIANARIEAFTDLRRVQLVGGTLDELRQNHLEALTNLLGVTLDELDQRVNWLQRHPTGPFTRTFQTSVSGAASAGQQRSKPNFTELFSTPVLDETRQVIGRLMVFRDITEEKELDEMREDLTGMIVHDLRSPLTVVLSGLEMIKEFTINEHSDPLAIQALQVAERSCHTMLMLVNSLLDISQLESGKMPLARAPAPYAPLARAAVSRLSPLAVELGVTVHTDLPPDLPMVEIDNEKIGRVLINLLDNALKFTPAGGQVTLCAVPQNDGQGQVLLCSVSDSGPGIPKEFHEKVFDRFAQVRSRASPGRQRGTGLGLAFCKLAIEAHNGRIWVESEPDEGSTFYFTLPLADVEAWLDE
jgi:GAF domain-containing protein